MANYATLDEAFGKFPLKKNKKSRKIRQPLCDYYANRYAENEKKIKSDDTSLISSNDNLDLYSKFDKNYNKCDALIDTDILKKERKKAEPSIYNKEEVDYFDKLYSCYDFKPMSETNGDNLMKYGKGEYSDENAIEKAHINRDIETIIHDIDGKDLSKYSSEGEDEQDEQDEKDDQDVPDNKLEPDNIKKYKQLIDYKHEPENELEPDKYYMDFGLYLISGILLIFILEQFVQIGLKIRDKRDIRYYESNNSQLPYQMQMIQPLSQPVMQQPVMQQPIYQVYPNDMYNKNIIK